MARKKKHKGGNRRGNAIQFSQIKLAYLEGNYTKTLDLLKKAKIHPNEVGLAKQLKMEATHQLAYQYFCQYEYHKIIQLLPSNFEMQARKGFPLPTYKSEMLLGLAYLYTEDFTQAAQYLRKCLGHETTKGFAFYYLLAELYQGKGKSAAEAKEFLAAYPDFVKASSANYKRFLRATFYMLKGDFAQTQTALETIKPTSNVQKNNVNALIHILKQEAFDPKTASSLKPLYKAFLNIELESTEKNYLSKYAVFEKQLEQKSLNTAQEHLHEIVLSACQNQTLIEKKLFAAILSNPDYKAIHSYLVYNQVANLFNENVEKNSRQINDLIKKYREDFFQIPESAPCYLSFLLNTEREESSSFFFAVLDNYLTYFKDSLSPQQMTQVGWKMYQVMTIDNYLSNLASGKKRLREFMLKFDELAALKIWQIIEFAFSQEGKITNTELNLFSLSNIQESKEPMLLYLTDVFQQARPSYSPFSFFNDGSTKKEYQEFCLRIIPIFLRAIHKYPPHRKARVTLDVLKLCHAQLSSLVLEYKLKIPETLSQNFADTYKKTLQQFNEYEENSPYYLDYQSFVQLPVLAKIIPILPDGTPKAIEKQFTALIKNNSIEGIVNYIFSQIDDTHFDKAWAYPFAILLGAYTLHFPEIAYEQNAQIIARFKKDHRDGRCAHDLEFIAHVMARLLKHYKKPIIIPTLYFLIAEFYDEMINHYHFEPIMYNSLGCTLNYIASTGKKAPAIDYDQNVINKVLSYLKKVVKARNLKTLGGQYKKANAYFKSLFKN